MVNNRKVYKEIIKIILMGTKGAWGFRVKEKDKVTGVRWDSDPTGLGKSVITYVAITPIEKIRAVASRIVLVNGYLTPPPELIKKYKKYSTNLSAFEPCYWDLLEKTQRDLFAYNKDVEHMVNYSEFLNDSLFCEWAYIINIDSGQFEVYQGGNKDESAPGRYARNKGSRDYWGVALKKEIPLVDITRNRVNDLTKELQAWEDED